MSLENTQINPTGKLTSTHLLLQPPITSKSLEITTPKQPFLGHLIDTEKLQWTSQLHQLVKPNNIRKHHYYLFSSPPFSRFRLFRILQSTFEENHNSWALQLKQQQSTPSKITFFNCFSLLLLYFTVFRVIYLTLILISKLRSFYHFWWFLVINNFWVSIVLSLNFSYFKCDNIKPFLYLVRLCLLIPMLKTKSWNCSQKIEKSTSHNFSGKCFNGGRRWRRIKK